MEFGSRVRGTSANWRASTEDVETWPYIGAMEVAVAGISTVSRAPRPGTETIWSITATATSPVSVSTATAAVSTSTVCVKAPRVAATVGSSLTST